MKTVTYDNNPGWADGFPWVVAENGGVLERFATLEECAEYLRAIDTTDSPSVVHLYAYEVAQETYRAAAKAYYERYESLTDEQVKSLRDDMLAADSAACAAWAKYIDSVDEEDE